MFTKTDIEKYFIAEKSSSLLFLIIGTAAIVAGLSFFFFLKTNFYKGAAAPLLLLGLLFGIIGFTVYKRSDADRKRNVYAYDLNPTELKEKEIPRMGAVMKNFIIYRWAEIILALAGIALFYYFRNNAAQVFWKGLGLTLLFMAVLALVADTFAAQRGNIYLKGLQSFIQQK